MTYEHIEKTGLHFTVEKDGKHVCINVLDGDNALLSRLTLETRAEALALVRGISDAMGFRFTSEEA